MYSNKELCDKWNNNIPASEIQGGEFQLLTDSQDLNDLYRYFPVIPDDFTGAIVSVGDGDYSEVYVTESSRPYSLDAIYHPLDYYAEE